MTDARRPGEFDPGRHVLLFDGVCGLCNRVVRFVLARDRRRLFRLAPLQGAAGRRILAAHGRDPDRLETLYVVADYASGTGTVLSRSAAVLFVVGQLGWPWRLATALRWMPAALRDRLYDAVAAHRYRFFGRLAACPAPDPRCRDRFLDA